MWMLAGVLVTFQQAVKLDYEFHHFIRVFLITNLLGDKSPISRLWGHGGNRLLISQATLD